jgi:membrane-associated phospholipid phosphatase
LQMRYGWGFGVPCYLVGSYVGFSRVYGQRHWFMDVLGGASIALAANVLFTTRYSKRKYKIEPILEEDRRGISVNWEL